MLDKALSMLRLQETLLGKRDLLSAQTGTTEVEFMRDGNIITKRLDLLVGGRTKGMHAKARMGLVYTVSHNDNTSSHARYQQVSSICPIAVCIPVHFGARSAGQHGTSCC